MTPAPASPTRLARLTEGAALGALVGLAAVALGLTLPWRLTGHTFPLLLLAGALAGLGPPLWLRLTRLVAGLVALLGAAVILTPLAPWLLTRCAIDDGPRAADVIVVLSAATLGDSPSANSLARLVRGAELLAAGVAPTITFTGDPPHRQNQFHVQAPELLRRLGLPTDRVVPFETIDVTPLNTHWEAVAIARMAERHGWRRALVVTSPSHTWRTRATFRAVGLDVAVTAAPAIYDTGPHASPAHRLLMFRDCVYELTARLVYRRRGWLASE